jgi:hypothetical protein
MNLLQACRDPNLFGPWFQDPTTWQSWLSFLRALFGLPLEGEDLEIYRRCTGRTEAPASQAREAWLVCGRRAGKSFMLALLAVYIATFRDWRPHLAPGERATVMVIACDMRQARVVLRYIEALLEIPLIRPLVLGKRFNVRNAPGVELDGRVTIEVHTTNFRVVRGYTIVAAILDEIAFWRDETSANPDVEIVAALKPAMATVPGSIMLCASSPYARRGVLWRAWRRHYGKDGPVLVWQAGTRTMNPTVPQAVIEEAYEEDPASAAAEYGAQFRTDVESYVAREVVEALVEPGCFERAPLSGHRYSGFVDPSGGSQDSMTLAIGHLEGEHRVLDCLRERRPPFSPEAVVLEFAQTLRSYGISTVEGDRYAGEWPREGFRKRGIQYRVAEKTKSEFYRDLLPVLNSRQVELLDSSRLIAQLCGLERRTARGGRDSIDHTPGGHDDLCNAAAGVIVSLLTRRMPMRHVAVLGV